MIIDKIENANLYYCLGERFEAGLKFLQNTDLSKLKSGRYEIDNDNLFVSVQDYQTKPESEGKFEAHRIYADIQFLIVGEEKLGCTNLENCTLETEYDKEKDIVFLNGKGDFVKAKENYFLIFMPQDAHMPCISINEAKYVKKAVVKVKI